MRRFALLLSLALALPAVASPPAAAQGSEGERTAMAREQFRAGLDRAREERWQQAADRFARALELRPSPQIRYNLAESLYRLDRTLEASEQVAIILGDEETPDDVRKQADELGAKVDGAMAELTIEVEGQRGEASVTLDGQAVSEAVVGVPSSMDPGRHVVRLVQGGEELDVEEVQLSRGASATVTLTVPPSATDAAVAASLSQDAGQQDDASSAAWWIGASAAVVVAAGVVTAVLLVMRPGDENPTQGDFMPGRIEVMP